MENIQMPIIQTFSSRKSVIQAVSSRQDEEHDNFTNTAGNCIYAAPMPLQDESKHKNNWMKGRLPPKQKY
jgi:hypothetical protein